MNNNHSIRARRWRLAWLICVIGLASGCTHRSTHWQEDVKLSDGSVLTVDRVSRFELSVSLGGPTGWGSIEEQLSFMDPVTGRERRWRAPNRNAAFFDRIDGRYWLVASSGACYPDQKGQRLLQAYVLDRSDWMRVEPEQAPRITAPNLVRWPSLEHSRQWEHVDLRMQREMLDAIAEKWKRPELLSLDLINSRRC